MSCLELSMQKITDYKMDLKTWFSNHLKPRHYLNARDNDMFVYNDMFSRLKFHREKKRNEP